MSAGRLSVHASLTRVGPPNAVTLLALAIGITGILFASQDAFGSAVICIACAAVLDGLDGFVARLLAGHSRFGAELDSLADVINFGVAPALVLYWWGLAQAGPLGWAAVVIYCAGAAIRLARFNSAESETGPYFRGVPTPAAAILALLPMALTFGTQLAVFAMPLMVESWLVLVAALMVSTLPTFSLKSVRLSGRALACAALGAAVGTLALPRAPWMVLSAMAAAYLLTLPVSALRFEASRYHATSVDP